MSKEYLLFNASFYIDEEILIVVISAAFLCTNALEFHKNVSSLVVNNSTYSNELWSQVGRASLSRVRHNQHNPASQLRVVNWSRRQLKSVSRISPRPVTSDLWLYNLYTTSETLKTNSRQSNFCLTFVTILGSFQVK